MKGSIRSIRSIRSIKGATPQRPAYFTPTRSTNLLSPPNSETCRYIVAANLLEKDPHHAATMVRFALRAQQEVAKVPRPDADDGSTLQMRMGELGDEWVSWEMNG